MPINIQWGPDPATVGRAAAYAGEGQFQQKQQAQAADAARQQQDYALRLAMAQEQAMMQRAQFALSYQQAVDRSQLQWEGLDLSNAQAEAAYYGKQDQLDQQRLLAQQKQLGYQEMNASRERIAEGRNDTQLEAIDRKYSASQKAELEKMNRQIDYLTQNEGVLFTPDQVKQGIADIQLRQQKVQRTSGLHVQTEHEPDLAQKFSQRSFTDDSGQRWLQKANGDFQQLEVPGQMDKKDLIRMAMDEHRQAVKEWQGRVDDNGNPTGPRPTLAESIANVKGAQAAFAQLAGVDAASTGAKAGEQPGPSSARTPAEVQKRWEQSVAIKGYKRNPDLTPETDKMLADWFVENKGNPEVQGKITDLRQILRTFGKDESRMPPDVLEEYTQVRIDLGLDPGKKRAAQPQQQPAAGPAQEQQPMAPQDRAPGGLLGLAQRAAQPQQQMASEFQRIAQSSLVPKDAAERLSGLAKEVAQKPLPGMSDEEFDSFARRAMQDHRRLSPNLDQMIRAEILRRQQRRAAQSPNKRPRTLSDLEP